MYATLLKDTLAAVLRMEGNRRINRDTNDTGSDDASGKALKAISGALTAVDLSTASPETFRNMAAAFRAAADELDATAAKF